MTGLAGRLVIVTREAGQAADLTEALQARGARVIEAPVIALEDPADWGPADAAIDGLPGYDRILFTSANAVERFARRLEARGGSPAGARGAMRAARVSAIGPATAATARAAFGSFVDEVRSDFRAEGLVRHLESGETLAGSRILLPRAETARETLPEALRRRGARVDVVAVYRTVPRAVPEDVRRLLEDGSVDVVTFTSGSTVRHFLAGVGGRIPEGVVAAVIGPVTADEARAHGLDPAVVAPRATTASLVEAIAAHYTQRSI